MSVAFTVGVGIGAGVLGSDGVFGGAWTGWVHGGVGRHIMYMISGAYDVPFFGKSNALGMGGLGCVIWKRLAGGEVVCILHVTGKYPFASP